MSRAPLPQPFHVASHSITPIPITYFYRQKIQGKEVNPQGKGAVSISGEMTVH